MTTLDERLDSFAEAWKPQKGDKLIGRVVDVDMRDSDYGDPYPIVTVERDDGTEVAFHGFHTIARRELAKKRPQIGDRIGIAYHGRADAKPGMSGAELYKIIVERDGEPTTIDWGNAAPIEYESNEEQAQAEGSSYGEPPPHSDADVPPARRQRAVLMSGDTWSATSNMTWYEGALKRSRREAKQTRERARRKQLEGERVRLLNLGADPEWIRRVLDESDDAA